jgi:hypothetical protein
VSFTGIGFQSESPRIQQVANRTLPQLIVDQLYNSGPCLLLLDNFEIRVIAANSISPRLGFEYAVLGSGALQFSDCSWMTHHPEVMLLPGLCQPHWAWPRSGAGYRAVQHPAGRRLKSAAL